MAGKLRWLSIAFIEYISSEGKRVLFDPWTKSQNNSLCPYGNEEFGKTDLVLVSHDHFDHIASAAPICLNSGAMLGAADETTKRLFEEEGLSPDSVVNNGAGYIVGGGFENDWIKVVTAPAYHTSNTSVPMGTIAMFKSQGKTEMTLYHTGDTSLTAEMEIYGRLFPVDVAFIPLFGQCMMDYIQAAEAVRLIKPKKVFPIHFDVNKDPDFELDRFIKLCRVKTPEVEVFRVEKDKWYDV